MKKTIFIVDDNVAALSVLENTLKDEFRVVGLLSAAELFSILDKITPDIILLDMPGTDGFDLLSKLKSFDNRRSIPVIIIAGENGDDYEKKCWETGAADFISKPYNVDVVKLRVQNRVKILSRIRDVESDMIDYKLTFKALKIAMWSMDVVIDAPVNFNNRFVWSKEFRQILGFKDENDFPNVLRSWYDCLHPDDKERSIKAFAAHINDYTGETPYFIEYRLKHTSGEYRYFDGFGTTLRDEDGVPIKVSGAIRDVTDIRQAQDKLKQRDRLLQAMNLAANVLLTTNDNNNSFESSLMEGMEIIGCCANAGCVEIWRNEMIDGELHAILKHHWISSKRQCSPDYITRKFAYSETPNWDTRLAGGDYICGTLSDFSDEDRAFLEPFGVKSCLAVPILIDSEFWGMCCIDNYDDMHVFTDEEIEILKSGTLMLANAINRNEQAVEIREAHKQTKTLLDSLPLACCLGRWRNGRVDIFDGNEEVVRLFGLKNKREFIGNFFNLIPEVNTDGRESSKVFAEYQQMVLAEGKIVFEYLMKKLDGTSIPCEITLIHVPYENDNNVIAGYIRDLREHKKMMDDISYRDKLLYASSQASALLLNCVSTLTFEGILYQSMGILASAVNVEYMYVWKNLPENNEPHCTRLYEWSKNAEKSDVPGLVAYRDGLSRWYEAFKEDKHIQGVVREMPPVEQKRLESHGIVSILVAPIFIEGLFWGFAGFSDHKSERVFTNEEESVLRSGGLMFANAWLRNEMIQNLRDTSANLEIALTEAYVASKAKSDFLSTMSHEMRTPLNAIIGMTAIGKKNGDIEQKDYSLNKIGEASSYLLSVINDVLDMAKIEADKLELAEVEFNFDRMLQNAISVTNFRIDEKQQSLSINVDSKIPRFIFGDDKRLSQVIVNLMSNAVKFTPTGGKIHVEVSLLRQIGGVCTLQIEVQDNGIGISPEQQEKLFDVFKQADSKISREYGGTGLGLAISKRIVELMGGEIWVKSELGKGARFSFTIKAGRCNRNSKSLLLPGVNWENIRILAVDDVDEILEQFKLLFGQLGIKCDTARGGEEACRIIEKRGEYDIYFVDWRMPGMDGIELTRRIKSRKSSRPSVVIMITAIDWNQIKNDAVSAGVDKHLLKPLFSSTIIDCVNECLELAEEQTEDEYTENGDGEFAGKRLLLAEDVEINREIAAMILEDTGLIIEFAENGQEALDMIKAAPNKYDIVFMDVQMPRMDGHEATRRIRELYDNIAAESGTQERLPIIALTANVFKDDIDACIDAGMDDHLGKPLDIDKILEKLRKFLKNIS